MDPDFGCGGHFLDTPDEFMKRNVEGAADVAVFVFVSLAHVEDGDVVTADRVGQLREVADAV